MVHALPGLTPNIRTHMHPPELADHCQRILKVKALFENMIMVLKERTQRALPHLDMKLHKALCHQKLMPEHH